jgi:hypothetical protein
MAVDDDVDMDSSEEGDICGIVEGSRLAVGVFLVVNLPSTGVDDEGEMRAVAVRVSVIDMETRDADVVHLRSKHGSVTAKTKLLDSLQNSTEEGGWFRCPTRAYAEHRDEAYTFKSTEHSLHRMRGLVKKANEAAALDMELRLLERNRVRPDGTVEFLPPAEFTEHPDLLSVVDWPTATNKEASYKIRCNLCHRRKHGTSPVDNPGERCVWGVSPSSLYKVTSGHFLKDADHKLWYNQYVGLDPPAQREPDVRSLSACQWNQYVIDTFVTPLVEDNPGLFASLEIDRPQGTVQCTQKNFEMVFVVRDVHMTAHHSVVSRIQSHYEKIAKDAASNTSRLTQQVMTGMFSRTKAPKNNRPAT